MARDYQRQAVYNAEDKAFNKSLPPQYSDIQYVKDFVQEVIASDHWTKHKGWKRVGVKDGRGTRNAYYYPSKKAISMPMWSRSRWIIIHELAHCLTHKTTEDYTAHGVMFCHHYLMLIKELLGEGKYLVLKREFDKAGVKYTSVLLKDS